MTVPLRLRLISSKKFEKPIYSVATGDFDGDGRLELAIGCGDGSLRLFKFDRGNLNSVWTTKSWAWVDHIIAADLNQDYIDELLVIMGKKLVIYKYKDPTYEKIWEIETNATITSVFVGDSNNNRQNELLIGCNDGSITIFAQIEEPFKFKKVWRKKYEGDTLISLGDLD
ncbi:MAG: FG-GAP repeat domain-containing protein, partial [Candidatus Helarchaeota archaeon]